MIKKSIIDLNTLQKKTRDKVRKKIDSDHYSFTKVECPICGNEDEFDLISKKRSLRPLSSCKGLPRLWLSPDKSENE
jgi:hypothetical protein